MIRKVLIANRGEISRRILHTLRKLEIVSVVIYDEREKEALYVTEADESYSIGTGPLSETFLNTAKIIQIARHSGVDAIHPGYGFLSENAEFAAKVIENGLIFIGPSPGAIKIMGDKFQAIHLAKKIGIPVISGFYSSPDEIYRQVSPDDFPLLIKASKGGGGKAMRIARTVEELKEILALVSAESGKYFGDGEVYAEKYLLNARHVEVQLLGDQLGNLVHLFERECSIQRRYQKIIEESPAVFLSDNQREKIISDALLIAGKVGYYSAGTIEFLIDRDGGHYFLEMNTRIQVEHAVTEMITGIDIIKEQVNIAAGNSLPDYLYHTSPAGHAIEARVYAEDSGKNFRPSPGEISLIKFPDIENLRIEHSVKNNDNIFPDYDPLIAKIIAKGRDRSEAISYLKSAFSEITVHGIRNNISLLINIISHKTFVQNKIDTGFLDSELPELILPGSILEEEKIIKALAGLYLSLYTYPGINYSGVETALSGYWRIFERIQCRLDEIDFNFFIVRIDKEQLSVRYNGKKYSIICRLLSGMVLEYFQSGRKANHLHYSWKTDDHVLFIGKGPDVHTFIRRDFLRKQISEHIPNENNAGVNSPKIRSPLSGRIIKVNFKENEMVEKGEILLVIESMKMENEIKITSSGKIKSVHVSPGVQVHEGDLLLEMNYE